MDFVASHSFGDVDIDDEHGQIRGPLGTRPTSGPYADLFRAFVEEAGEFATRAHLSETAGEFFRGYVDPVPYENALRRLRRQLSDVSRTVRVQASRRAGDRLVELPTFSWGDFEVVDGFLAANAASESSIELSIEDALALQYLASAGADGCDRGAVALAAVGHDSLDIRKNLFSRVNGRLAKAGSRCRWDDRSGQSSLWYYDNANESTNLAVVASRTRHKIVGREHKLVRSGVEEDVEVPIHRPTARLFDALLPSGPTVRLKVPNTYADLQNAESNISDDSAELRIALRTVGSDMTVQILPLTAYRLVRNRDFEQGNLNGTASTRLISDGSSELELTATEFRILSFVAIVNAPVSLDNLASYAFGDEITASDDWQEATVVAVRRLNVRLQDAGFQSGIERTENGFELGSIERCMKPNTGVVRPWVEKGLISFDGRQVVVNGEVISTHGSTTKLLQEIFTTRGLFVPKRQLEDLAIDTDSVTTQLTDGGASYLRLASRMGQRGNEIGLFVEARRPIQLPDKLDGLQQRWNLAALERKRNADARLQAFASMLTHGVDILGDAVFDEVGQRVHALQNWNLGDATLGNARTVAPEVDVFTHRPLALPPRKQGLRQGFLADFTVRAGLSAYYANQMHAQQLQQAVGAHAIAPTIAELMVAFDAALTARSPRAAQRTLEVARSSVYGDLVDEHSRQLYLEVGAWWARGEQLLPRSLQRKLCKFGAEDETGLIELGKAISDEFLQWHADPETPIDDWMIGEVISSVAKQQVATLTL